jgi:type II secretory pathway pseudopilin PulG
VKTPLLRPAPGGGQAFTLVEVTLALGIVAFALVGILGTLPIALANGRQSMAEGRAAAVANTLFTDFRTQPFTQVCYLDDQFKDDGSTPSGSGPAPLNLTQMNQDPDLTCYAVFSDPPSGSGPSPTPPSDQKNFSLVEQAPASGMYYVVNVGFNDQPAGAVTAGEANRVDLTIWAADRPADKYRFVSTVAHCSN